MFVYLDWIFALSLSHFLDLNYRKFTILTKWRREMESHVCFVSFICVFIPLRNFIVLISTDERGTNPVSFCLKLALGRYGSRKQRQMLPSSHQWWCSAAENSFTFFLVKHLLSSSSRSANFPVTEDNPVDKVDKSPPLPVTYLLLRGMQMVDYQECQLARVLKWKQKDKEEEGNRQYMLLTSC